MSETLPIVRARAPSGRSVGWLLVALGLVLLLTAAERQVRAGLAGRSPAPGAEWIWADGRVARTTGPRAFYAVTDLHLDAVPSSAEARVLADEEYVLWLNGRRVGSNRYREHAGLDRYQVGDLLLPNGNRIVAEVRSGRGAGGLLLALVGPEGEPLAATGESWRIFEQFHPGVVEGWVPTDKGAPAVSWGPPPTGRWGRVEPGRSLPRFEEATGDLWRRRILFPERLRARSTDGRWVPAGEAPATLGPIAAFDWGRPVTGYLVLEQRAPAGVPVGLVELAPEEGEEVEVVFQPGAPLWRDVVPRRFRFARVTGLSGLERAWVEPVDPEVLAELPAPPAEPPGVFGLDPPPLRTPVQNEVRRELESLPRRSGWEGL